MRVHPAVLPVLGDQPTGQALDPRLVGARAVRATPAIAQRRPPGTRGAQLLRREGLPTAAARARRPVGLRSDDPRFGHDRTMIRTRVPTRFGWRGVRPSRRAGWQRSWATSSREEGICRPKTRTSGACAWSCKRPTGSPARHPASLWLCKPTADATDALEDGGHRRARLAGAAGMAYAPRRREAR